MAAIDISIYDITENFNLSFALAGGTIFAKEVTYDGSNPVTSYYLATNFRKANLDGRYPYTAVIEDIPYNFNALGVTNTGKYSLVCVYDENNETEDAGEFDDADDTYVVEETSSGGGTIERRYNLSKLNFVEMVAMQALNALIGNYPDKKEIPSTMVKLLSQKAFEFSKEFTNRAIELRTGTTGSGGGGGGEGTDTYVPVEYLNGLDGVTKIVFCTSYPASPQEGVLYVKLKIAGQESTQEVGGGQA